MKANDYLKFRSIIPKDKNDLMIRFDDKSEVSLVELLESYLKENTKCKCCAKRQAEICVSCVSDLAQSTAEQAIKSR